MHHKRARADREAEMQRSERNRDRPRDEWEQGQRSKGAEGAGDRGAERQRDDRKMERRGTGRQRQETRKREGGTGNGERQTGAEGRRDAGDAEICRQKRGGRRDRQADGTGPEIFVRGPLCLEAHV